MNHLLTLLLLILPLGMGLIWLLPRDAARHIALASTVAALATTLLILGRFDHAISGFQLIEKAPWIATLNIHYMVGVDGISVLFLPATALLFLGVVVASWNTVRTLPRLYFSLLLLLQGATLGIFCALDTLLFFLFWELTLAPLYFLTALWGVGPNRRYAAAKYTLVMLAGGVPLLFAFIMLAFNHASVTGLGFAFDLPTLLATPLQAEHKTLIFLLLLLGFAVKAPVFPFHTWLPVAAMEGPPAVTALLVGLKLGAFGLIRFAVPLVPDVARELHWLLAGLGTVGLIYGAVAALAQTNLRRMLAYSSISHVGLVILGIASFNLQGLQGALLQLLNFSVVAGGLFLATGFLHHRTGSTDILSLGGAARSMPLLASFFLIFGLAGMGLPGTSGFPAELLILISALKTHTGAALAALFTMVISAAYFLSLYRRAFFGPVKSATIVNATDLRPRELTLLLALALLTLGIGLVPSAVLDFIGPAGEIWAARLK